MIPKIIHCVWLSGETKPELYQDCIDSWHAVMPDYELKEWSLKNLPKEVLEHPFVKSAIAARKWAFATDYIRLWALYTFGGVYMDTDVYVYRKFDPFLSHRAFGCVEFIPSYFYKSLKKKKLDTVLGLNVDAAILGSEKGHKWIADLKEVYDGMMFRNDPKFYKSIIMPVVMSRVSLTYGFKYVPSYQVLKDDIHLYPADVFAYCYAPEMTAKDSYKEYGDNQIRYACHMCAHSWYEFDNEPSMSYKIKHTIISLLGKGTISKLKRIFGKYSGNPIYNGIKMREKV